jgi:hypothetical protein
MLWPLYQQEWDKKFVMIWFCFNNIYNLSNYKSWENFSFSELVRNNTLALNERVYDPILSGQYCWRHSKGGD